MPTTFTERKEIILDQLRVCSKVMTNITEENIDLPSDDDPTISNRDDMLLNYAVLISLITLSSSYDDFSMKQFAAVVDELLASGELNEL